MQKRKLMQTNLYNIQSLETPFTPHPLKTSVRLNSRQICESDVSWIKNMCTGTQGRLTQWKSHRGKGGSLSTAVLNLPLIIPSIMTVTVLEVQGSGVYTVTQIRQFSLDDLSKFQTVLLYIIYAFELSDMPDYLWNLGIHEEKTDKETKETSESMHCTRSVFDVSATLQGN